MAAPSEGPVLPRPGNDECFCNGLQIRSGAKLVALLDQATAVVVLVAITWEYAELKYISQNSTPIVNSALAATVAICLCVTVAATFLLLDALSDRGLRYRWLLSIYVCRRLISALCLPAGILIAVIGLISAKNSLTERDQSYVRLYAERFAAEIFDEGDFVANRRIYVDGVLGSLLTSCVLAMPFDLWASVVTYQYCRYAKAKRRCRQFLSAPRDKEAERSMRMKVSFAVTESDTVTDMVSDTDFVESLDVTQLIK